MINIQLDMHYSTGQMTPPPKPKKAKPAQTRKVMDRFLTHQEEKRLFQTVRQFNSIEAQRDFAWMLLLRSTGIRVGALAGLLVSDAREALADKHLKIRAEINKGKAAYSVFLGKNGMKALQMLLKARRDMGHPEQFDAPLILSRESNAMSIRAFQQRCQHWGALANVPNVSPHWFRHTLAMRIMQDSTAPDPRAQLCAAWGIKASTARRNTPNRTR